MPLDIEDLKRIPEFAALLKEVSELRQEVRTMREAHPLRWVNSAQAEQLTGLSRRTLARERERPGGTLLVFKEDHGVRYCSESLRRYNASRAVGRGRLAQLLSPTV